MLVSIHLDFPGHDDVAAAAVTTVGRSQGERIDLPTLKQPTPMRAAAAAPGDSAGLMSLEVGPATLRISADSPIHRMPFVPSAAEDSGRVAAVATFLAHSSAVANTADLSAAAAEFVARQAAVSGGVEAGTFVGSCRCRNLPQDPAMIGGFRQRHPSERSNRSAADIGEESAPVSSAVLAAAASVIAGTKAVALAAAVVMPSADLLATRSTQVVVVAAVVGAEA